MSKDTPAEEVNKAELTKVIWLNELIDIRNKLYNDLPTGGDIKAWDLLQMIKWHINDIDNFCSLIQKASPPDAGKEQEAVEFHDWILKNEWEINSREQRNFTTSELYTLYKQNK